MPRKQVKVRISSLVPRSPRRVQKQSPWVPRLCIKEGGMDEERKCGQARRCWRGRLGAKRGRGCREIRLPLLKGFSVSGTVGAEPQET